MRPEFVNGNLLQLLCNGTMYFPALVQALDEAKHEVYLESYIFTEDDTGRIVAAALSRAARRGLTVHVLVDGFGSKEGFDELRRNMLADQVRVLTYRPNISPLTLRRNRLRRMHRKLAVIDARIAFIGGINIIDDMDTPGHKPPRYDYAVRIEGPLLDSIADEARRLWNRTAWTSLRRRWRSLPPETIYTARRGTQRAALVVRDNLTHRTDIEEAYLDAIEAAREEIIIANAYFFPGVRFRRALIDATLRGVRVILLLQGRVEYALLHYASRALYGQLLEAGVQIYEYHLSFMHAKVAVIDRRWSTVGSSNIDPFSLLLAREANLVADDAAFALELHANLLEHMESGSQVLAKSAWHKLPLLQRMLIWVSYGFARLLMGMAGYGGKI